MREGSFDRYCGLRNTAWQTTAQMRKIKIPISKKKNAAGFYVVFFSINEVKLKDILKDMS